MITSCHIQGAKSFTDRQQWWCFTCNDVPGCWQTDSRNVLPVMITSCHIQGAKSLTDRWAEEFSDLAGLEGQTDTDFWNKLQEHWQEADRWCTLSLWPSVVTMHLFVSIIKCMSCTRWLKKNVIKRLFFLVLHHPYGKFWSPYLVRHSSHKSSATHSCQQR